VLKADSVRTLASASILTRCGTGTECSAEGPEGHTYTASVEDSEGHSFGGSSVALLDMAELAGDFVSGSAICTALLTDPYETHLAGSSVGDQELACEAAVGRGANVKAVLAAVAATGTAALYYLLKEHTEHEGGFSLPSPTEAEPYPIPTTLPAEWPVERVATALEAKNSESELTKEEITDIAQRCLWYTAAAGDDASECTRVPIFLPGSDVKEPATTDLLAMASRPSWVRLNNESGAEKESKGEKEGWYKTLEFTCLGTEGPEQACHEYPFYASEQGGPPGPSKPQPRIEWVNKVQNGSEGSKYSGFKSACELTGTHRAFLVVPVLAIPTTRLCNK
jgi:hypothetical protein